MNSDLQTFRPRAKRLRQPWRPAVCLAAVLCCACAASAGEKIRITETPAEKVDMPKNVNPDVLPSDGLPSKIGAGESSQGPVLPAPNQPSVARNPKFEEWLDRKRNWIYESPNDVSRDKALQEMFGVRDYELSGSEKKPKKMVEQYFDSTKEKKNGLQGARSQDGLSRDSMGKRGQTDTSAHSAEEDELPKRDNPGIIPELNPAILFNPGVVPDALAQADENMNRNPMLPHTLNESPIFGQRGVNPTQREPLSNQRDFDKIWDSRSTPLGRLNDPINQQSDATRAILQPIAARKASAPVPESSQGRMGDPFGFGAAAAAATRPDLMNLNRAVAPSTPSFTPSVTTPSAPLMQPKPGVLEIPRPRF